MSVMRILVTRKRISLRLRGRHCYAGQMLRPLWPWRQKPPTEVGLLQPDSGAPQYVLHDVVRQGPHGPLLVDFLQERIALVLACAVQAPTGCQTGPRAPRRARPEPAQHPTAPVQPWATPMCTGNTRSLPSRMRRYTTACGAVVEAGARSARGHPASGTIPLPAPQHRARGPPGLGSLPSCPSDPLERPLGAKRRLRHRIALP